VGHASDYDALTGCTVILCESGAVGGIDIRGAATGTEEIDVLWQAAARSVWRRRPASAAISNTAVWDSKLVWL
jgi:hypothetical protein